MDSTTKDIALKVIDRLKFDDVHNTQAPIGRVQVLWGPEREKKILWIMRKEGIAEHYVRRDVTGHGQEVISGPARKIYHEGQTVCRDAPIGRILTEHLGTYNYIVPSGDVEIELMTKASFTTTKHFGVVDAQNTLINTSDVESRFGSLIEALQQLGELRQRADQLQARLDDEKIEVRATQLRAELDAARTKIQEEANRLSRLRNEELKLRDQPVLDAAQEDVKRSNLLNGGLVISGAPGTGKTTSLIQRISFLTSRTLLESVAWLGKDDEELLFGSGPNWLFFSPNDLLKMYLKDAMQKEELSMSGDRVETWAAYRRKLLRAYGWIGDLEKTPFHITNESGQLLPGGHKNLADIRSLFIEHLTEIQQRKVNEALKTALSGFDEKRLAPLQEACKAHSGYRTLEQYARLYITLHRNFQPLTGSIRAQYKELLDKATSKAHAKIQYATDTYQQAISYLHQINSEKLEEGGQAQDIEEEGAEVDTILVDSTELVTDTNAQLDDQLDRLLARLLRDLALRRLPSDLSKTLKGLWKIVSQFIDQASINQLSPYCLYLKAYAPLTNGLEANLLANYPTYYKQFRRLFLADSVVSDRQEWFAKSIRDRNKKLHPDEFDFLLWNLHQLIRTIYQLDPKLYAQSSNSLLSAFRQHTRVVIAIDEASDFSAGQLQAMASLSHPKYNSVTLCGDLMQRMTTHGITTWDDFSQLWPNTVIKLLTRAYRQTPILLDIARCMYTKIIGQEPPFTSYTQSNSRYAKPLFYQNDDQEQQLAWVVQRILEINQGMESRFPTIALFVENDRRVDEVYKLLHENEILTNVGLDVDACREGRILGEKQAVRIFSVEYIKGMEFEAVFILNVDQINEMLLNQYLYVGLTRANFYLALTASNGLPNSLLYLESEFIVGGTW